MWWLLLIPLIALGLWLFLKPAWAPQPQQVQSELAKNARLFGSETGKMYRGIGGKLKLRRDKAELVTQFRHWAGDNTLREVVANTDTAADAAELNTWLGALSEKDLRALSGKIARYAAEFGFDLAWLWDDQLHAQPELKMALEQAVAFYCLTTWRTARVQDRARAFVAWKKWQANPKKNVLLGQKMYSGLVQRGLVGMDPALYMAPEKTRRAQMNRSILQVAQEKPEAVNAIVFDIVNPQPKPPAPEIQATAQA